MAINRNKMFAKVRRGAANIDSQELFSRTQRKAYELFEKKGYTHGDDWTDWLKAERLVKKELGIR
ncbi:MAG: DUF2934 domain-containing protein [Candidatus Omnitrophica bacterium]|nr:DUF2934 domain-containing protein [Candidatus Omnitrophota bacterium]